MARKRRAKYDISHLKSTKFSRRHFMVRSAAGIAGAATTGKKINDSTNVIAVRT